MAKKNVHSDEKECQNEGRDDIGNCAANAIIQVDNTNDHGNNSNNKFNYDRMNSLRGPLKASEKKPILIHSLNVKKSPVEIQ